MKALSFAIFISILLLFSLVPVFGQTSVQYCISNTTLQINSTQNQTTDGTSSIITTAETYQCPYGCDATRGLSGACSPDPTAQGGFMIVPVFVLLIIGFSLLFISAKLNSNHAAMGVFLFLFSLAFDTLALFAALSMVDTLNLTKVHDPVAYGLVAITIIVLVVFWYFFLHIWKRMAKGMKHPEDKDDDFSL